MEISLLQPVDYLLVGHLTVDLTENGKRLGGTAAYSALTARALGMRVGVVTSWAAEIPLTVMDGIQVASFPSEHSTMFENRYSAAGRAQHLIQSAERLDYYHVPEPWRSAEIVHLGPVAQEVETGMVRNFPAALVGVTPQGWLRGWDTDGRVYPVEWPESAFVLERAGAAVSGR